jgi:hypothetical protein
VFHALPRSVFDVAQNAWVGAAAADMAADLRDDLRSSRVRVPAALMIWSDWQYRQCSTRSPS